MAVPLFRSLWKRENLEDWRKSKPARQSLMFSRMFYFATMSSKEFKAALVKDEKQSYFSPGEFINFRTWTQLSRNLEGRCAFGVFITSPKYYKIK